MKTLEPEQWRILGHLISRSGARTRLNVVMKTQDVSPEAVCDLAEHGLILVTLDGDGIDLTPGLIKTHRRNLFLQLTPAGESYYWRDPHRVLRSLGTARHGLYLQFLLGSVEFEDLARLHRKGLISALTADDDVDLGSARRRWPDSLSLVLPGGAEAWIAAVLVRITKSGYQYCDR